MKARVTDRQTIPAVHHFINTPLGKNVCLKYNSHHLLLHSLQNYIVLLLTMMCKYWYIKTCKLVSTHKMYKIHLMRRQDNSLGIGDNFSKTCRKIYFLYLKTIIVHTKTLILTLLDYDRDQM